MARADSVDHREVEASLLRAEIASLKEALHDATAEKHGALREQRRLKAALDLVPVGVLLADGSSGRILLGNTAMEDIVGHKPFLSECAENYGEWPAFHGDGQRLAPEEFPLYRIVREGVERASLDVHYQRPTGERRWVRIIGSALEVEDTTLGTSESLAAVAVIDVDREVHQQEEQALLLAELDHRVKNVFATMIALVNRSLRGSPELEAAARTIEDRIHAYAHSHAVLTEADWAGSTLGDVVQITLASHLDDCRIHRAGPEIPLPSKVALALSMVFHELVTNATKYGALSTNDGRIDLTWEMRGDDGYSVSWRESGGPAVVKPERRGFGSFITETAIALEAGGSVSMDYAPDGVVWCLSVQS